MTYRLMVEGYPNLKEEVGGSNPGCEISSLFDGKTCQVVNCLLCFGAGLSAFCLKIKNKNKMKCSQPPRPSSTLGSLTAWALSPTAPQVSGVTPGSPLCPWCYGHSSWKGARQARYVLDETIVLSSSYS